MTREKARIANCFEITRRYDHKADLLSDIQTLALAGCGWKCPRDVKDAAPRLCLDCREQLEQMLIAAAFWKSKAA